MKNFTNKLSLAAILLFACNILWAQSPHKMSYQAVVRNSSFSLVVNKTVGMKISILQGSATGTVVYSETQTPTTNGNGLATVEIGSGTIVSGTMSGINWASGPFFIKTETDPAGGTSYSINSTTQFLSVPYALYSLNSGSSTPGPQGPAGPAGPTGPQGPQGPPGVLSVNCLACHTHDRNTPSYKGSLAEKRDNASQAYPYSLHAEGETAFGEGTNASCAPCHSHEGFYERITSNIQPTYTGAGPYTFSFSNTPAASSAMSNLPNHIGCFTCHKSNPADSMKLMTTDSVRLLFYSFPGRVKYGNLPQNGGKSNLCMNCHNSRPLNQNTTAGNGSAINFADMATKLDTLFYDSTKTATAGGNKYTLSRTSVGHYGWVSNVLLGVGYAGMEIPGSVAYTNSAHTTDASCVDCHMATPSIVNGEPAGGHTFSAVGNYKGCNSSTDCHQSSPLSASSTKVTNASKAQKANLDTLCGLLMSNGKYLISIDTTFAADGVKRNNLWYKFTTQHFDGYFNIGSGAGQFTVNNTSSASKWPTLTNGQFGALINASICIREYSGGMHNTKYTNALLRNSIAYLRAHPIQ